MACGVGSQGREAPGVAGVGEHAGVPAQQVLRGVIGPATGPVAVGPGVQAPREAGEGVRPEAPGGLLAQGRVGSV